jgi:hypothetical protein
MLNQPALTTADTEDTEGAQRRLKELAIGKRYEARGRADACALDKHHAFPEREAIPSRRVEGIDHDL